MHQLNNLLEPQFVLYIYLLFLFIQTLSFQNTICKCFKMIVAQVYSTLNVIIIIKFSFHACIIIKFVKKKIRVLSPSQSTHWSYISCSTFYFWDLFSGQNGCFADIIELVPTHSHAPICFHTLHTHHTTAFCSRNQ